MFLSNLPVRDPKGPSQENDIHVMPTSDPQHTCQSDCWCEPVMDYVSLEGKAVWIHKKPS